MALNVEKIWQQFSKQFFPHPISGCWLWVGNTLEKRGGYGTIKIGGRKGKTWLAHRFSWLLSTGKDPGNLLVCHHCDNPRCVNPMHLFLGTHKDNAEDRDKKGRHKLPAINYYSNKKTCIRGHPFDETNTYFRKNGHRICKICRRERSIKCRQKADLSTT